MESHQPPISNQLDELLDLVRLTRLKLLQQAAPGSFLPTDPETYNYYRDLYYASKAEVKNKPNQIVSTTSSTLLSTIAIPKVLISNASKQKSIENSISCDQLDCQTTPISIQEERLPKKGEETPNNKSKASIDSIEPIKEAEKGIPQLDIHQDFHLNQLVLPLVQSEISPLDLSSIKDKILSSAPQVKFIQEILNDQVAQNLCHQWKKHPDIPRIALISFQEEADSLDFIKKISLAIHQRIDSCALFSAYDIATIADIEILSLSSCLKSIVLCSDPSHASFLTTFLKRMPGYVAYKEGQIHPPSQDTVEALKPLGKLHQCQVWHLRDCASIKDNPQQKVLLWKGLQVIFRDNNLLETIA